jgi:hypothetical protein
MRTDRERLFKLNVGRKTTGGEYGGYTQKDPENWVSGDDPMTGAQASYLKTLSEQTHRPDPTEKPLTKAEASELIDKLRNEAGLED